MLTDQWFVAMSKADETGKSIAQKPSTPCSRARCASCPSTGSTPTTSG
jgi:hypothetical protein